MLKTITIEKIDEKQWLQFKSKCILNKKTIQEGFNEMLRMYIK